VTTEVIDHPAHYQTDSGIEAIDVMERYGLGPHLFVAMKHLLRAGRKGDVLTDLKKADWYLSRPPVPVDATRWRKPSDIVDAFGLEGAHRDAVWWLLCAALQTDEETKRSFLDGGLRFLKAAITEAEKAQEA
jgi:hypothetical protein